MSEAAAGARPAIGLTLGDPCGIGPELWVRILCDERAQRHLAELPPLWLFGDAELLARTARALGRSAEWEATARELRVIEVTRLAAADSVPGRPSAASGAAQLAYLEAAITAAERGELAGLVTGPIHKARLARRGFKHAGHTDLLGELAGVARPVMAFVGGRVRVALVTVHLPLRAVPERLTSDGVAHVLRVAHAALRDDLGLDAPRLLVCGLNPHAGDEGLLGDEERTIVAPAIAAARREGVDARGPVSAEAAFLLALRGEGDMVVAMYHDQGLAPLKALDFGRSVNWTLGLPFVRTSVDHGTGDDLVGTGRADPSSMRSALELACALTERRPRPWRSVG